MKKVLSQGLVIFAGVFSLPARVANPPSTPKPQMEAKQEDPRVGLLRKFFRSNASPAEEYSEEFLLAADQHTLDWRLLPSISLLESGGGRYARNNNLFGWDCGRASFASVKHAIHEVAYNLSHARPYRNRSLDAKLAFYNQDASYAPRIKSLMQQIAVTPRLSTSTTR